MRAPYFPLAAVRPSQVLAAALWRRAVSVDRGLISPRDILREDCVARCPDLCRADDEANRLRALLARLLERLPADHPLLDEILVALD